MSYELINWENAPSTKTPINAENLKHMDEGIAKAHEIEAELEIYKANSIISTSSGTVFHETDCAAVPPINIKLFGKSKQDGIPSMETPIIPVHHGESGSIGGKVLTSNLSGIVTVKNENLTQFTFALYLKTILHPNTTYKLSFKGTTGNQYYLNENLFENWDDTTVDSNGNAHITLTTKADISNENHSQYDESNGGWIILKNLANNQEHNITDVMLNLGDTVATYEPYTEQPFTSLTPNGLRGIPLGQTIPDVIKNSPIHMSGVYWDSAEGQYYIADTKNENGKEDVQRIGEYVADANNDIQPYEYGKGFLITNVLSNVSNFRGALCNQLRVAHDYVEASSGTNMLRLGVNNIHLYLFNNSFYDETLEDKGLANFKAHLNENPLKIWTWLDEPIITESTDQYDVVMNYPNTTIVNDEGAYMEVTHVKDTQKHIEQNYVSKEAYNEHENRIAELEKAIVNS